MSASCTATGPPSPPNSTLSPTSITSTTSTCSISALPSTFYLQDSVSGYLTTNTTSKQAHGTGSEMSNTTTIFHIRNTSDGSLYHIPQLAFFTTPDTTITSNSDLTELAAYINTTTPGGPILFLPVATNSSVPPGLGIVSASFSTYKCYLVLITFGMHDLSYIESCAGGVLALDGGRADGGCEGSVLRVTPVADL